MILYNLYTKGLDQTLIPYDGTYPYVNWIGRFSTGVIRYGRLIYEAPSQNNVQVSLVSNDLPEDWTFALMNPAISNNDNVVYDLNRVAEKQIVIKPEIIDGHNLCDILIICRSDVEGEFITELSINGEIVKIGCEFWGENELLKINLANKGIEFSNLICKAIYSNDLYEDHPDWMLLNRKYRELLINYMDILGNKGSYKSLINSLKWFEYYSDNVSSLPLVDMQEVWKYATPDGDKYYTKPIQQWLSEECERSMFNSAKTTYIALRQAKKEMSYGNVLQNVVLPDDPGFVEPGVAAPLPARSTQTMSVKLAEFRNVVYEIDKDEILSGLRDAGELPRDVLQKCLRWSEQEMRLKMVLLGNFFEQYFMPIHLDLIRSVVEDISVHVIIARWGSKDSNIEECYTEAGNFELDWGGDEKDPNDPDDPGNIGSTSKLNLHLDEVHVQGGSRYDDPYKNIFVNTQVLQQEGIYHGLPYTPIVSCHKIGTPTLSSLIDLEYIVKRESLQTFHGIGAVATGIFKFEEPIVAGSLETDMHGQNLKLQFRGITNPNSEFALSFLFQRPGNFTMIFRFVGQSGKAYTKIVYVHVEDNLQADVIFKKLVGRTRIGYTIPNVFDPGIVPDIDIYLSRTQEQNVSWNADTGVFDVGDDWLYEQFLPIRPYTDNSKLPHDAPYKCIVYTVSADNETQLRRFQLEYERYLQFNRYIPGGQRLESIMWINKFTGENGKIYMQMVPKIRGKRYPIRIGNWQNFVSEWYEKEIFIPELHKAVDITTPTVKDCYPIVCIPVIRIKLRDSAGEEIYKTIPYSYYISSNQLDNDSMWEFFSWNKQDNINKDIHDPLAPFISWEYNKQIPKGFYTITFRYRYGDHYKEVIKHTPFKIVSCWKVFQ